MSLGMIRASIELVRSRLAGDPRFAAEVVLLEQAAKALDQESPDAKKRKLKRDRQQRFRDKQAATKATTDASRVVDPATTPATTNASLGVAPAVSDHRSLSEISQSSSALREQENTQNAREAESDAGATTAATTPATTLKGPRRVTDLGLRAAAADTRGTERRHIVEMLERAEHRRDDEEQAYEIRQKGREAAERLHRQLAAFDIETRELSEARSA